MNVIKASAGSGKTYTLAKCYIEQLLFYPGKGGLLELRKTHDYHQHILAITFTNKATNEMKQRIIRELSVLAHMPEASNYYSDFKQACSPQAIDGLQQAASNALATILNDYSTFRVSTIDTFFQTVLRSFARELDRDYNYDLEIQGDYVARMATMNFLMALGKDHNRTKGASPVEKWVQAHIKSTVDNGGKWSSIFTNNTTGNSFNDNSLAKFAEAINNEFLRKHLDDLCQYLSGDDDSTHDLEKINAFIKLLRTASKKASQSIDNADHWQQKIINIVNKHGIDGTTFKTSLKKIYEGGLPNIKTIQTIANAESIDNQFKKGKEPSVDAQKELQNVFKSIVECFDMASLFEDIANQLSYVGLLGEIKKQFDAYRQENNIVLVADTTQLINKVIQSQEDAPFIYERTSTWTNSYMLDEFQDTSKMQYDNFKPLLQESLSHATDNFNLVIGDAKQAIYRFRNADPSLFRDRIDEDFKGQISRHPLNTNYRSLSNIIQFNNEFTRELLTGFTGYDALMRSYKPNGKDEDYMQLVSPANKKRQGGMVKVLFNDNSGNELIDRDNAMAMLPEYLLELHQRFEWKDINILVNTNKDGEAVVEAVLEHNKNAAPDQQINIRSGEAMRVNRSSAVRRIVEMLRFIDLTSYAVLPPENEQDVTKLHTFANRHRNAEQRQSITLGKFIKRIDEATRNAQDPSTRLTLTPEQYGALLEQSFGETDEQAALSPQEQIKTYADQLAELLPDYRTQPMSLVNIVDRLISTHVSNDEDNDEIIYLHAFQNIVLQFAAQRNGGTVREFLRYWEQKQSKCNVPEAGDDNSATVLTIHKSKGLEAKCVVLPCVNWKIAPSTSDFWVTRDEWINQGAHHLLEKKTEQTCPPDIVPPILHISNKAMRTIKSYGCFKDTINKEDNDNIIDLVNKTYVAFTRPKYELHIFAVKSNEKTQVSNMLRNILEKECIKGMKQTAEGQYTLGKPFDNEKDKDDKKKNETPKSLQQQKMEKSLEVDWKTLKLPPYKVTSSKLLVDLPDDPDSIRIIGKRLHVMLSRMDNIDQLDTVLNYCERRGIVTNDTSDQWNRDIVRHMLASKLAEHPVCDWFDPANKVLNERSLWHNGEILRPDRIVVRPDGTIIVVDYKFGSDKKRGHISQVKGYMEALRNIYPGHTVKGYLWYVTLGHIQSLS